MTVTAISPSLTSSSKAKAQWTAKMIAPLSDQGQGAPASFVSREFSLKAVPNDAILNISALGLYRCFINGSRVGNDLLTPGWVCYDNRLPFQTYSVSDLLIEGNNRIEIWLADGWYRSPIMWEDERIVNCWGENIAAIAEITAQNNVLLKTDTNWKSGQLPIIRSGIYYGEFFDATTTTLTETHGCELLEFDYQKLTPQECTPVQKVQAIAPVNSFNDSKGRQIFDYGQNVAGFDRFTVEGEPGARVIIEHAEVLGPHQEFDNRNYRSAEARIEYILSGKGSETYEPHFTFYGFRYSRVTIKGNAILKEIHSIPISSVPERAGEFKCGSPLVNRLVENTVWSQRANFIEVPTDCPQRDERLGWTGDAQVFAGTACYLADSHEFLRKYLRDVMVDQRPDGAISHFSPDPTRLHANERLGFYGSTGWGDAITVIPWVLYTHYGDREVLEECYDAMIRWVDFIWSISDGPLVFPPVAWKDRGFTFGDWLQPIGDNRKPEPTIGDDCAATLYHFLSTELVARIAGILGKSEDQQYFTDRAEKIRSAFATEFITPSGRLAYSDQTSYALAFMLDLIPEKHIESAKKYFRKTIEISGGKIGTGFIGTPVLLPALCKIGAADLAAQVFLQTAPPGWLYQVTMGATSIWERWDSMGPDGTIYDPEMNSYNHYAYGAVCQWLYESIAGFRPDPNNPGFKNIIIEPNILPELAPVSASHQSKSGPITVNWSIKNDQVLYEINLPEGTTGELRLLPQYSLLTINGKQAGKPSPIKLLAGKQILTFRVNQHEM